MKVRYIGKKDTVALDRDKLYEVISIERGWYRIVIFEGEVDGGDYLVPPEAFEIVEE